VFVTTVEKDQFTDGLEALGTLHANESVILTASVTETVTSIHFDDGDRISAGQILLEMTSAEEHAQLEETRARVKEAKSQYDRVKSLAAEGTAAKSLLDERKREWETARAQLAAIVSRLDDRLVRAPFNGVVGLRNISIGALVTPGTVITTLDDDSVMKLDFSIPSTYLPNLHTGLEIIAKTRAIPDRTFKGEVKSIDSRVDPVTRAVVVRAVLANDDRVLKPGMLMQINLLSNPRETLFIPEESLVAQGQKQFVLVVNPENNKVTRREVKIGSRRPGEVEIMDGLQAGENIITDGAIKVRPGQTVTIRAKDDGKQALPKLLNNKTEGKRTP
jgi:membrane fusion protein (multidrug efflux system)